MKGTVKTVGLLAMLFVAIGGPVLFVNPVSAAEMIETDKAMMKATGEDLQTLKKELAAIQSELQKLTSRLGKMSTTVERATSNYCQSIPQSLKASGFSPGVCK